MMTTGWMFADGVVFCPAHASLAAYDGTADEVKTWKPLETHIQHLPAPGHNGGANPLQCHWCDRVYGMERPT